MEAYQFKDLKPTPDKMFTYSGDLKDVPLIIDNGSYTAKVGWACRPAPEMVFRNLITKVRKDKSKKELETQIGNDIVSLEVGRLNLRTQFDRGVVTHFEAQETLLDYTLTHLGVDTPEGVRHPIVISEAVANLNSSRAAMSELLFECYRVPSVSYFVDALTSLRHNLPDVRDALVISCGHHATHIIPVLDGCMEAANVRRVGVGGLLVVSYLQRLLQLRYPAAAVSITMSRAEELFHNLCHVAEDYIADLTRWAKPGYVAEHRRLLQLPISTSSSRDVTAPAANPEAAIHKKRKAQARMLDMHRRKRLALVADAEQELAAALDSESVTPEDLQALEERVDAAKAKLRSLGQQRDREAKQQDAEPKQDVAASVESLQTRRRELLERRAARRRRRVEMARRRTAASQQRMRIISQLAHDAGGDDRFGQNDDDWDVYKSINKEGGSDSEADGEELAEVESRLRRLAPQLPADAAADEQSTAAATADQLHQLPITTELIQAPEVLFQPSLLGLEQAGIAETVQFVLAKYSAAEQQRMAEHVFVTGGCAKLPGLRPRLLRELAHMRPFQSTFSVILAGDPSVDAWRGARAASIAGALAPITRAQYLDSGVGYLSEHRVSNVYCPTPTPTTAEEPAPAETA